MSDPAALAVDESSLARELDAICASASFRHSPQLQRFLRHLVATHRGGDSGAMRETVLGIEVFRRPPGNFDPKSDPIVRVEARRLRQRLAYYYAVEGEHAPFELVIPLGSYAPIIRARAKAIAGPVAAPADARALEERATYVMRFRTIEGYRKALELFTRAATEFPDYAAAFRGIAWARICIAGFDGVPPEAGEQSEPMRAAIEAARALEPDHPHLQALAGGYAARFEYALDTAEKFYRDGLSRMPLTAPMLGSAGWLYTITGRFAEAQRAFGAAYALDPFGFWHRHNLASLAYYRRDYDAALRMVDEALELEPDHAMLRLLRGRILTRAGRGTDAVAEIAWCKQALPGMTGVELIHIEALASAGEREAAANAMRDFERRVGKRYTSPVYRAMAWTELGDFERALEWLEHAAADHDYWLLNIAVDPAFDRLRPRAEFSAILRNIGLPDSTFIQPNVRKVGDRRQ